MSTPTSVQTPTNDTVVNQPSSPSIFPESPPLKVNKWSQGLCGCLADVGLSASGLVIPCVVFGKTAEALNKDCFLWGCLSAIPCVSGTIQRGEIRERKGIEGTRCNDFLAWAFCPYCALIQEACEMHRDNPYPEGQIINRA